ncbi:MAG: flagellar biosynthetic protein FliO [Desulfobacteraceae bacterium]|nr:flagellar biosynthetic protein FliO [Desulfobacteraceae bacterium]
MNSIVSSDIAQSSPDVLFELFKSIGVLLMFFFLLLALLFFLKRMNFIKGLYANTGPFKVLARFSVSPKSKIILLDVDGEKMLIGITPNSINYLKTIENYEEEGDGQSKTDFTSFKDLFLKKRGPEKKVS